jgi:amino acid adenylation domain-containing protein
LVEEFKVPKDSSRHPIFQVMFGVQSFGADLIDHANADNILKPYSDQSSLFNVAKFDISTLIDDSQIALRGSFNYAVSLYKAETIVGFAEVYYNILKQFAQLANQTRIAELNYLSQKQYSQIIEEWNQTDRDCPKDKTIHRLFEEQVGKTPNNIALVYGDITLTYQQLNERANRLAHYLVNNYVIKPDTLIALCLDRSEHMLISILAILKAGGAYVPMDPSYPDERIKYILKDTKANVVLANQIYKERLDSLINQKQDILAIDSVDLDEQISIELVTNLASATLSTNLAYVIYTSGTTGNPKGVLIEHKGVVNLVIEQGRVFDLANSSTIKNCLWYANYVFDAHVWDLYVCILYGHIIHITDNAIRQDIELLSSYVKNNNINIATLPPVLLDCTNILALDKLTVTGDKTPKEVLDGYYNAGVEIINGYGPTEVTVGVSLNHYNDNGSRNVGRPMSNMKAYVLSANLTPLPIGAIGELYIGGIGLARGYLNQSELTAERFIPNPFQTEEEKQGGRNSRLYKTGDLLCWRTDGNLEYIGRNDSQVKIRGYRVELGEIESAIANYVGIKQSVVLAKEHLASDGVSTGNKYLVAYYVSATRLAEDKIIACLQSKLPEYMLPNILVHLEKLPMTTNGKLDKRALPDPEFSDGTDNYVAPRDDVQKMVCRIWAEVLKLPEDKVGICDDFFRLGGNSILAIKLISKLNKAFNISISISAIFQCNTVEKLVCYLEINNETTVLIEKAQVSRPEEQVLSFAQERLWFIQKYEQGTNAYNIPMVFELTKNTNLDSPS